MKYYSVFIPSNVDVKDDNEDVNVFTSKDEALKVFKSHKDARLKDFQNENDAIEFSRNGPDTCTLKSGALKSPVPSKNIPKAIYRAPTKQELVILRKYIEEDKYDKVEETIWDNPRYLINSGDTPTSLKEATRYNALHVCAIHNRARIAELILQTVSDGYFIELLHGKKDLKICEEVAQILLDYYLNMPEKGRSETPLHLAVKYGAAEVVEVLTRYPQCKMTSNTDNLYPKDIVCFRMDNPNPELKNKISAMLEERYYVPVIRSIDNSLPPTIGDLFSPNKPLKLNKDPLSPEMEIQAYAGPMNKDQANNFRKRWKTPPRMLASPNSKINFTYSPHMSNFLTSPLKASCSITPINSINNNSLVTMTSNYSKESSTPMHLQFDDAQNGNVEEKINRCPEIKNSLPIIFNTPIRKNRLKRDLFFTYRDKMGSNDGMNDSFLSGTDIQNSINKKYCDSPSLNERHVKLSDTEKGLELIGRELAKEQRIEWTEYWDFLDCFIDITTPNGLIKLENYLKRRKEGEQNNVEYSKQSKTFNTLNYTLNKFNNQKKDKTIDIATSKTISYGDNLKSQINTPHLCVEKSIQVFARRMANNIFQNISNVPSINNTFSSELKKLKSLMCSFKDDTRFVDVDFSLIHSRFAKLIVTFIHSWETIDAAKIQKIQKCFNQMLQSKATIYNETGPIRNYFDRIDPVQCVSKFILDYLPNEDFNILPTQLTTESLCINTWNEEKNCDCSLNTEKQQMNRNTKRNKKLEFIEVACKRFHIKNSELIMNEEQSNKNSVENNAESWNTDDVKEIIESDEDDDDDVFWSDIGSDDDEIFYTPPEYESMNPYDDVLCDYKTYLLGDEPTKRDVDVANALTYINIDRDKYPNIYLWKTAVLRHSKDERECFPSPKIVKHQLNGINSKSNTVATRRLFTPPQARRNILQENSIVNMFQNITLGD